MRNHRELVPKRKEQISETIQREKENIALDRGNMNKTIKRTATILVILSIVVWIGWRISTFYPIFPHKVSLPAGIYLRSPYAYSTSDLSYDPAKPPLAPEVIRMSLDRKNGQAVFYLLEGEEITVPLGAAGWVKGCENHYRMESIQLATGLQLGSVVFQNPVLMVVCGMWSRSEGTPPAKVILREGPLPTGDAFYLGPACRPEEPKCLYFAMGFGTLKGEIVDAQSGEPLPGAHIILTNAMGIQEYAGSFSLPLYAGFQMDYRIFAPGYPDQVGNILHSNGTKLDIMH